VAVPDGRYVPLATEVHRNKKAAPLADISSSAVCLIGNFLDSGRQRLRLVRFAISHNPFRIALYAVVVQN